MQRYFKVAPPFEDTDAKKHEFPDAFALLALEAIGKRHRNIVICVSADKGWHQFAEASEHLVCVPDIETALSYFTTSGRETAEKAFAMWQAGEASALMEEVNAALEKHFDYRSFDPEADSGVSVQGEPLSAYVQSVDVDRADTPIVIFADEAQVTFTVKVPVTVVFEASFSFHVKDWVDRDDVLLDTTTRAITESVDMDLVISVAREIDPEPEVLDVEVSSRVYLPVHFGYMDPFEHEMPDGD